MGLFDAIRDKAAELLGGAEEKVGELTGTELPGTDALGEQAQGYSEQAQGYADQAQGYAEGFGDQAQGYADQAQNLGDQAQGHGEQAQGYAQNAADGLPDVPGTFDPRN